MKVLTLNTWLLPKIATVDWSKRLHAITAFINANDYDLVFLQEVWTSVAVELISQNTDRKYTCISNVSAGVNATGLMVLTKQKPNQVSTIQYPSQGYRFNIAERLARKGFIELVFSDDDYSLSLINTHMYAAKNPLINKVAPRQLEFLISKLNGKEFAVIGDINIDSKLLRQQLNLDKYRIWDQHQLTASSENQYQFKGFNRFFETDFLIDYAITSQDAELELATTTLQISDFSDHYPVEVDIKLPKSYKKLVHIDQY